jgi:hypothetical protein
MSHNLTSPSKLPLTIFVPSGDNAIVSTPLSPSRQSFHICFPLFKLHTRSEPSSEQVIIRCPSSRCMAPCPSNFLLGFIVDVSCFPMMGEAMINFGRSSVLAPIQQSPNHHLPRYVSSQGLRCWYQDTSQESTGRVGAGTFSSRIHFTAYSICCAEEAPKPHGSRIPSFTILIPIYCLTNHNYSASPHFPNQPPRTRSLSPSRQCSIQISCARRTFYMSLATWQTIQIFCNH